MTSDVIALMSWHMPRNYQMCVDPHELVGLHDTAAYDIMHYAECFKNLKIGWDFAAAMAADSESVFPAIFHGDDLYVWRAYRYLKGDSDPDVEGAIALEMGKSPGRDAIRAMLVNEDGGYAVSSSYTNIRKEVIKAYEKLFFNVRDRLKDHAFIASVVYPDSRMVEAYEEYITGTGIDVLMLRAGYTKGIRHVLYASGLTNDHPYAGYNAMDGANELDKMFMQDGVFIGSMGFMHQKHNNIALSNARLSMQASKMGGNEAGNMSVIADVGSIALDSLSELTKKKAYAMSGLADAAE